MKYLKISALNVNMISLITVTQGNPKSLRRTIDSTKEKFQGLLNEVIVGDVSVTKGDFDSGFEDARLYPLAFNHLLQNGFAATLNILANKATNDLCLYLNVAEIVESQVDTRLITSNYNCYRFNHSTDPHIWVRLWDRRELQWSGRIHESIIGPRRECCEILFTMADTPKDNEAEDRDPRFCVYNDLKQMVYYHQYVHIVRHPEELGATDPGWMESAIKQYDSNMKVLTAKGERYQAFLDNNLEKYMELASKANLKKEWD